jgi:hypothetical protein
MDKPRVILIVYSTYSDWTVLWNGMEKSWCDIIWFCNASDKARMLKELYFWRIYWEGGRDVVWWWYARGSIGGIWIWMKWWGSWRGRCVDWWRIWKGDYTDWRGRESRVRIHIYGWMREIFDSMMRLLWWWGDIWIWKVRGLGWVEGAVFVCLLGNNYITQALAHLIFMYIWTPYTHSQYRSPYSLARTPRFCDRLAGMSKVLSEPLILWCGIGFAFVVGWILLARCWRFCEEACGAGGGSGV